MSPLLLALGVGALGVLAYKRYESVKPGDTVQCMLTLPGTAPGTTQGIASNAKVLQQNADGTYLVQPQVDLPTQSIVAPSTLTVGPDQLHPGPNGFISKNLTPRLF